MAFKSILYKDYLLEANNATIPDFFKDLHLDLVVSNITKGKENYKLNTHFYNSLPNLSLIIYRQDVMKDVEDINIKNCINNFSAAIQQMNTKLKKVAACTYRYQKERLFIDAVFLYCNAVMQLKNALKILTIHSEGLTSFIIYLETYTKSEKFLYLKQTCENILEKLQQVHYTLHIKDLTINILPYQLQTDYTPETQKIYNKFSFKEAKNYKQEFLFTEEMNNVEAEILKGVASLYPQLFEQLCNFYQTQQQYTDATIITFDNEIQFYIAYLDYIEKIKKNGCSFCYPVVQENSNYINAEDTFDIALAYKLTQEKTVPVTNTFSLSGKERIIIVSGPNQGGKTTFARTFAQLHYLAKLGCCVPGTNATLTLYDNIYTHFERIENLKEQKSKLEQDLLRIYSILNNATDKSIIILNEIFSSTTLQDAQFLCEKILKQIVKLNNYCVWVSFIHELVNLSDTTVSMVSTIVPENPSVRTFKIIKKNPDGIAYALSLAQKYKLTYQQLTQRINN